MRKSVLSLPKKIKTKSTIFQSTTTDLSTKRQINFKENTVTNIFLERLKTMKLWEKSSDILEEFSFFKGIKNLIHLNYLSIKEGPKDHILLEKSEISKLLMIFLEKIDNEFIDPLLCDVPISNNYINLLFSHLNDTFSMLIKSILPIDEILSVIIEQLYRFFILFTDKLLVNNEKRLQKEILIKLENLQKMNEKLIFDNKSLENQLNELNIQLISQKKSFKEQENNLMRENGDLNFQLLDLRSKIEELLSPEMIDEPFLTMKNKCDDLTKFVNKIETCNEEQGLIFSKGIKELAKATMSNKGFIKKGSINEENNENIIKKNYNLFENFNNNSDLNRFWSHPFIFYLPKGISGGRGNVLEKMDGTEISGILYDFIIRINPEEGFTKNGIPSLFIEYLLILYHNLFNVSLKLTEICDFLKLKHENHSCFSLFYGKLFGMFKFETISREITYWLTNFLSKFETFATKPKPNIFDIEDQSYFYWKDLIDVLNKTFRENEELKENIEVKFIQLQKEWKITKKEQRKKIYQSVRASQDFPLITLLLSLFKLTDIVDVIEALKKQLGKFSSPGNGILKYSEVKIFFLTEYSINTSLNVFEKYFKNHIDEEKDEFYSKEFLEDLKESHVEEKNDENKINYYEILSYLVEYLEVYFKERHDFIKKRLESGYLTHKIFDYTMFKNLIQDLHPLINKDNISYIYKETLLENFSPKVYDKIRRNNNNQEIIKTYRTENLEFPIFYEKEKIISNFMKCLSLLEGFQFDYESNNNKINLFSMKKKESGRDTLSPARKSTLKKNENKKKSSVKVVESKNKEKETSISPTFINGSDNSQFSESPSRRESNSRKSTVSIKKSENSINKLKRNLSLFND